jgi:hypothetical protein
MWRSDFRQWIFLSGEFGLSGWQPSATAVNLLVGGLQIKIPCLRCDGMAALEVENRATTVAKHAERARSTGKKEDQLSQDSTPGPRNRHLPALDMSFAIGSEPQPSLVLGWLSLSGKALCMSGWCLPGNPGHFGARWRNVAPVIPVG